MVKGSHYSEEQRKRLCKRITGKNNPFFGKHHSEETKQKIRKSILDKYPNGRKRNKTADYWLGKKHTEETKKKISIANKGIPKSLAHRRAISGMNHYNWKGGITKENDCVRNSVEYRRWAESIKKRDKWTCQQCNKVGGILIAHHIFSFAEYIALRFDINNGITLCQSCHKRLHNSLLKVG